MGDISKLAYDTEVLRSQASAVNKIRDDLQSSTDKLISQLDSLTSDWVSGAADKFFAAIDTSWMTAVADYCDMLDDVSRALSEAADSYDPIEQSYNRLNLDV